MKKIFTLILTSVSIFGALSVNAQSSDTTRSGRWFKRDIAGAIQLQATYRKTDLNQLNQILNSNNIPSLSHNNIWINASMSHIFKKFIVEDGIGFTPITSSEVNGLKAKYNQYQAFLRFGYNIAESSSYRLYPFAGINFSAAVLGIKDNARIENTDDFSQEILNSTSSKTFYQPNFGIDLGAGFDYLIKVKSKQMDNFEVERNIPIGVRVGYYINAYQGDWKIEDHSLQNGPDNKNSAFFVTFNVGLGYYIRKR
ncbi:hypothetical protein [Mucilaginibacter sp.]|jgi:hypothetical protein|uniref:hypothetical protein n=1 Tax=Mucilaginibacter sp. TaxID=1882438 RepID=UPI00356AB568